MNYETLSPILKDIVEFIKSFVKGMRAFINGFKTSYEYGDEEAEG